MIVASTYLANWRYIYNCRRCCQLADNGRKNKPRIPHEYKPDDLTFLLNNNVKRKLQTKDGPFKVVVVHSNRTITIQHSDCVREQVNIRRLHPAS
eukprot:5143150-Ditylum_brightwellii.AAC.1